MAAERRGRRFACLRRRGPLCEISPWEPGALHQRGMPVAEEWRCYFEDPDGIVLVSTEIYDSPYEAVMWGNRILSEPGQFELEDPDGHLVDAFRLDPSEGFTVESDSGQVVEADGVIEDYDDYEDEGVEELY